MPTETEIKVMRLLTAIEIPPSAAEQILAWGNEAVTVVCEAALGVLPGLRDKVRTNAVALLGWVDHPQAMETLALLVTDPDQDVAARAMRAAGRRKSEQAVDGLARVLTTPSTAPILAAEAVKALQAIGSGTALAALSRYEASADAYPHRNSTVVRDVLSRRGTS
jgi:hypothetical protein